MKTIYSFVIVILLSGLTLSQNPDTSLIAFFPFNGNAIDESVNDNDGTVTNAILTTDRFGENDKAYYFNGTNARIEIPNSNTLNLTNDISISAWIKADEIQTSGNRLILGKSNYLNATNYVFKVTPNGYIQWEYNPFLSTTTNPLVADSWYHIVLTSDSTNGLKQVFINGSLIASETLTSSGSFGTVTNPLTIGAAFHFGSSWAEFFKGSIDDIRLYNRILSNDEITALYNETNLVSVVDSVYPNQNSTNFNLGETIKIFFTEPMEASTLTADHVYLNGNLTGKHLFDISYQAGNNSVEIQPTTDLKLGELISVTIDSTIKTAAGNNITPFIFQFNVEPNKGSLKFTTADTFQLDFSPSSIISADLNNDGKIDVVVSDYDSSKYTIALNNGLGGFTTGEVMSGLFKPNMIAFSDIDNDRDLDMIIATNSENKIQIYNNTGQGIFNWTPPIDAVAPISICPGDFDGDGDNDFVAMLNTGFAVLYKNIGNGSFVESSSISIASPVAIRNIVGDIDNDGDLDIIGGTSDYWGVFKILKNDGKGNFTYSGGAYLGPYPDEIAGGDFNGDYHLDFVKCDWYQNGVGIAINNGSGEYPVENFLNLGNVGGQTRNPIVNDFDGDGDLDFVGVFNNNNVGIVKNNTHPNYELSLSYPIPGLKGIAAGDFDANGSVDLVGINSTTNQIIVIKNCLDSLVAYFPFSNDTKDVSGNLNNAVNYSGVFSKDRYAIDSSSIYFNGVDSYVEGINPGNNLPVGNSPRTFSAWIKNLEYNQWGSNIFHYGTAQAAPTNFHFLITDVLGLGNGYGYGVVYGNTNLNDSVWHFVTGVYEGGTERIAKLYVDGKLDVGGVITSEPNTVLTNNWRIGRFFEGGTPFKGNIDELKIYNISLTNEQVWEHYKTTTTAPNLLFPGNDSTLINPWPTFILEWDSTVTANEYQLLIANDSLFNATIHDTILSSSSYNFYDWFTVNIDNLYWKVRTINDGGIGPWSETNRFNIILTDVKSEDQLPTEFALMQNYPNPFNPSTRITYHLPKASFVEIKVYDIIGSEIATLVNEEKSAGIYSVQFVMNNLQLSSGIYFYQLNAGDFVSTMKMILLK